MVSFRFSSQVTITDRVGSGGRPSLTLTDVVPADRCGSALVDFGVVRGPAQRDLEISVTRPSSAEVRLLAIWAEGPFDAQFVDRRGIVRSLPARIDGGRSSLIRVRFVPVRHGVSAEGRLSLRISEGGSPKVVSLPLAGSLVGLDPGVLSLLGTGGAGGPAG